MSHWKPLAGLLLALAAHQAFAQEPVTLAVGEQNYYNIEASMEASGALKDAPYRVQWKHFQAAAPIAESLNGQALDLGFLGDSGLLTLAARGAPVRIVAVSRQNLEGVALLVPANSPVKRVADLKGRKVAVWRGAWSQQLVLRALQQAGVPADAVQYSYLMPVDAIDALASGAVDAVSLWEPFVSTLELKQHARPIATAEGLMPALSYVAATDSAATAKHAAIADFLRRAVIARRWVDAHPKEYAALWAKRANLDVDVATRWLSTAHQTIGPVDERAARDTQETADFLTRQGVIPAHFDTSKVLDRSYNDAFSAPAPRPAN